MEKEVFISKAKMLFEKYEIEYNENVLNKFYLYMKNLLEWNQVMNLTAIKDEEEIIIKHFLDSAIIIKYIVGKRGVDVGSGAGFPGIPLKIINDNYEMLLVDSVNKKVNFMNDTISKLDINNIKAVHNRAEEIGQDKVMRESFDFAVSRAVANMATLVEYLLPLVKVGGKVYCLKGPNLEEELNEATAAIEKLGGKLEEVKTYNVENNERTLVIISKTKNTEQTYPRKMGKPLKEPIR